MSEVNKDYLKMVGDAGLPTTEAEAKALWQVQADAVNSPFNNSSDYSPFWRSMLQLVTVPLLWLINDLLVKQILPNFFLKTATDTYLDMFGWAVDCERKAAAKAMGMIQFSRVLTAGEVEIPLGTIIQSPSINGKIYSLVTTAPAAMIDGQGSILVSVEAKEVGAAYNLATGYYSILPQAIAGIDAVANLSNWLLSAGADIEGNDDYRLRIRNQYTAVNQYHTDAVYRKIITTFANINTRNVYFEHNAPRGPGTANAYILMDVGEPSSTLLAQIEAHIMTGGNHGHGDDLQVFAMPGTDHALTVTIVPESYASEDEIDLLVENIHDAVGAAFRQNSAYVMTPPTPYSIFSFSNLAKELHNTFSDLHSVRFSLTDITTGLNVPRLTSLQVVVDD